MEKKNTMKHVGKKHLTQYRTTPTITLTQNDFGKTCHKYSIPTLIEVQQYDSTIIVASISGVSILHGYFNPN